MFLTSTNGAFTVLHRTEMKLLRLTARIECRPRAAGPLSSPIRNPATQTQKRELGTGETMKTLRCGRVECSGRDEGRNVGDRCGCTSGRRIRGSMASPPPRSGSRTGVTSNSRAEMCIKIIYVQSLSHKILIIVLDVTPSQLEVNDVPAASTRAEGTSRLFLKGEGMSQTWPSGHHQCTSLFFFFLEDFLAIYSKIKEIRLVKKKIFFSVFRHPVRGCTLQMEL